MDIILKKYTSIPSHLYVNRNADIQLRRIIEDMQRPGYVLVARQMGKTNLLFNAKRTLENKDRLFAYVDLSNLYENERDCYRNIINNITEPNQNYFSSINSNIEKIREKNLPPHNEYSRSLIEILNIFKGDLVVILDEIDALKSVNYSDNIFAQIRSNYFSRTNYQVLERLTYVLSGVIEPTELIKDKNKSPFNIGDKIYLDDFTKSEHDEFILKSKLKVSDDFSTEIYNWAKGNPRLTFDICAEVEQYLITNSIIDSLILEQIIKDKYLTSYDIAPIDHIRELVRTNKQVREAVVNIYNNDSASISDTIKSKLYLYGIISSNFGSNIEIKNKIISESLSLEWIKSIERSSKSLVSYGLENIEKKEFEEGILNLKEYLLNYNPSKTEIEICNYNLGFAYYSLKKFKEAIEYFAKEYTVEQYKSNAKSIFGVCLLSDGQIEEGRTILKSILETKSNDFAYRNAAINLAQILIHEDTEYAIKLYEELLESLDNIKDDLNENEQNQLKTLCLFSLADILENRGHIELALTKIELAERSSSISNSLSLLYTKYNLMSVKDENLKQELVSRIIENQLKLDSNESYPINFTENHVYYYLNWLFNNENNLLFEQLLTYANKQLIPFRSKYEIILFSSRKENEKKVEMLKFLFKDKNNIESVLLLNAWRDYLYAVANDESIYYSSFFEYLELFKLQSNFIFDDVYLFALMIKRYSDKYQFNEAILLCQLIESRLNGVEDEELKFECLIIYYWHSNMYFSLKNYRKAIEYAEISLDSIKNANGRNMSLIDEAGFKSIEKSLLQIKSSSKLRMPVISEKKYGRNERVKVKYGDGKVIENKYKVLEADILASRCVIL